MIATLPLLFGIVVLVVDPDGGGLTTEVLGQHPLIMATWLAMLGVLVVAWRWSIRTGRHSVRVDADGLWIDGELVVEPHHIDAVGVQGPAGWFAGFRSDRIPPPEGAGWLERVRTRFSPEGWVRHHRLPNGGAVAVPGAQDIGGRSGSPRVVIVLDRHVAHHVRDGWAIATWRPEELLAALAVMAPDAELLGVPELGPN